MSDPLPDGAYESADYWDIGFRVGEGYGAALLSTGRLTNGTRNGLNEDRDDEFSRAVITHLVCPGDPAMVWAWHGEGWIPPGPKRRFDDLGDDQQQACRLGKHLGIPTGIKGHADSVLIFPGSSDVHLPQGAAKVLHHWEKTLRRSLYGRFNTSSRDYEASDPLAAEARIGELAAKIGILAQLSPDGMDSEIVVFHAKDHYGSLLKTAAEQAARQGRALCTTRC